MGRHVDDGTRMATRFDAQFLHSQRMAEARRVPLQDRVVEYVQARREEYKNRPRPVIQDAE